MKTLIYYYLALSLLIFLTGASQAQTDMKVNLADGSTEYYDITEIRKLTFDNLITNDPDVLSHMSKIFNQLKSYPNPTSHNFTIEYRLESLEQVTLQIQDINGKLIHTKDLGNTEAGSHSYTWDLTNDSGNKISTGTYICNIISKDNKLSNKVLIVK